MDELHVSLTNMLISDFRYIRSLNAHGCLKLYQNLSTIEQILSLLAPPVAGSNSNTHTLQPAHDFYRLAAAGPEKFIELAPSLPTKFTMPQYQSIFDVYYRDYSGNVDLLRTYNNQLVRLKYLLDK